MLEPASKSNMDIAPPTSIGPPALVKTVAIMSKEMAVNDQTISGLFNEANRLYQAMFSYFLSYAVPPSDRAGFEQHGRLFRSQNLNPALEGHDLERVADAASALFNQREIIEHMQKEILPLIEAAYGRVKSRCDEFTAQKSKHDGIHCQLINFACLLADERLKRCTDSKLDSRRVAAIKEYEIAVDRLNTDFSVIIAVTQQMEEELPQILAEEIISIREGVDRLRKEFDVRQNSEDYVREKGQAMFLETDKLLTEKPTSDAPETAFFKDMVKIETTNSTKFLASIGLTRKMKAKLAKDLLTFPPSSYITKFCKKNGGYRDMHWRTAVREQVGLFKKAGHGFEDFCNDLRHYLPQTVRCFMTGQTGTETLSNRGRDDYLVKAISDVATYLYVKEIWDNIGRVSG